MKQRSLLLFPAAALAALLLFPPTAAAQGNAPVVANVVAQQVSGTGLVQVSYDVSDADGDSVTVSVIFSSNNGAAFDLLPRTVTGDVYRRIALGAGKSITWNAAADYPGFFWPQVVAKVIANDGKIAASQMVLVPGGAFLRGSSLNSDASPPSTVTVDSFYIDKYEVTNAEYQQFIDAAGYTTRAYWSTDGWTWRTQYSITIPLGWGTAGSFVGPTYPGFPVKGVSWFEAEAYANFTRKRLPTEAEWEKAARGTDGRIYPWGNTLDVRRANWLNSGDPNDNFSTPVGYFNGTLYSGIFQTLDSPSPYGCYDMVGNAWEWVKDWYASNYYSTAPAVNPPGPSAGTERVLRGGAYDYAEAFARTYYRFNSNPAASGPARSPSAGFRLAKPASP